MSDSNLFNLSCVPRTFLIDSNARGPNKFIIPMTEQKFGGKISSKKFFLLHFFHRTLLRTARKKTTRKSSRIHAQKLLAQPEKSSTRSRVLWTLSMAGKKKRKKTFFFHPCKRQKKYSASVSSRSRSHVVCRILFIQQSSQQQTGPREISHRRTRTPDREREKKEKMKV